MLTELVERDSDAISGAHLGFTKLAFGGHVSGQIDGIVLRHEVTGVEADFSD